MASKVKYTSAINRVERRFTKMEEAVIQQTITAFNNMRRDIAVALTEVDEWNARQLQQMDAQLQARVVELDSQLQALVNPSTEQAAEDGAAYTAEPLATIGINIPNIGNTLPQLAVIQDFVAGLITGVTDEAIQRMSSQIRLAALGNQSSFQTMQQINKILGIKAGHDIVGGISYKAERIFRTELNRLFNIANRTQQEETAKTHPEITKRWLATGDIRTRDAHIRAHGQEQPIDEPFKVGGAELMYPLDPTAPAKETVNCRCRSVTIHPSVGVIETPLDKEIEKEKKRRKKEKTN